MFESLKRMDRRKQRARAIEQITIGIMVTSAIVFYCFVLYIDYLDRMGF